MSRRCFEQMLDELDLVNFSSYHRWYASHNPACYSMPDMHQDYRNAGRLNRFDFYTIDYYRQPYWMPQNLFFPSYEPFCLLRRSDRRKNYHFSREKRNNGEKRFFPNRHEDIPFRVDRGKNADFLSQFDRRYQPAWNRDASAHHYQLSRDDRNSSRLSFKNSNIDLCTEDMMVDQHLQNFKQVFENRNPSSEGLTVGCSASQNGLNESSVHSDSNLTLNFSKASEMEWNNLCNNNRFSDGASYKAANNFSNSYESWYCPEEQQQIIDTLKEVNLRHDRQLKRDMLIAKGEQQLSDESMSANNDSQNSESLQESQSSEDDDDFINILLSPGAAPPIPETTNEEDAKEINSGYLEKSASDFFEEFQNIFSGSPERKIFNNMTKESLKTPYVIDEEEIDVGRKITEVDKKAVKAVLNFDNVDDILDKPFENSSNIFASSPKENSDNDSSNKLSPSGINSRDLPYVNEEICEDSSTIDAIFKPQPSNIDCSMKLSTGEIQVDKENASPSFHSKQTSSSENSGTKFYNISSTERSKKENVDSKLKRAGKSFDNLSTKIMGNCNESLNNSKENYLSTVIKRHETECQSSKCIRRDAYSKLPLDKNYGRYWRQQAITKEINKHSASLNRLCLGHRMEVDKNLGNIDTKHKSQCGNRDAYTIKISSNLSSICSSQSGRESLIDTLLVNKDSQHKETFGESLGSLSEPMLTQERNEVVYKRISLSEIFNYANAESEKKARVISGNQQHLENLIQQTENLSHLSPSEHLKQLLGIGQNMMSEEDKIKNNSSRSGTTNKMQQSQCAFAKNSAVQNPSKLGTSENCCIVYKEHEISFPQKHTCCTTVMNTPVKNELPENIIDYPKFPSNLKLRESGTSFYKKRENIGKYWEENLFSIAKASRNLNSSFAKCAKNADKNKYSCCHSNSNYDTESKPNNVSKNSVVLSPQRINKGVYDPRVRTDESGRTHSESDYKTKTMDTYNKSRRNRRQDCFHCCSSESSYKNDEIMNNANHVCKSSYCNKSNETMVDLQAVKGEHGVLNSKSILGSPKGKRKFKKRNRKEKVFETRETRRNSQNNCKSNAKCDNILQNIQSERISPEQNKQVLSGKSRNAMRYKYEKNLSPSSSLPVKERNCESNSQNEDALIRNYELKDRRINEKNPSQKFSSKTLENREKRESSIKKEEITFDFSKKSSNLEKKHSGPKEYESREFIKRWSGSFRECTSKVGEKLTTLSYNLYNGQESKMLKSKLCLTVESKISCESKFPTSETVAGINKPRVMERGKFKGCLNKTNYEAEIPLSLKEACNLKMKNWSSNPQNNFNQCVQYLKPNTLDLICERESTSRGVRCEVPLLHSQFLNSFLEISPFTDVMSGFKCKTQRMLEEAEKIASLVEKRASNLSLEEIRLKRSKRRKHIGYNLLSNANNGGVTQFSICRNFSYKQSLLDKVFPSDKVFNTSSERTVIYTFKRIDDIDCSEFLKRFSDFASYKKGREHRGGYIVRYTKEFQGNDNIENCVSVPNELKFVKSEKIHFHNLGSNQEFQLCPLTDDFFEIHVRDIISQFDSMKLSERLQKSLQLCINTEVEENIFQALPLLLSFLTVLSTLRVPWSRKNLKELIYFRAYEKKKLGDVRILVPKTLLGNNNDCDILKCWDILSCHLT